MARTQIERVEVSRPDTAVFRMEGKLGFHENNKIKRLAEECLKREFKNVVFDFTELSSLGGGVARILREMVTECGKKSCSVKFVITNDVVLDFLDNGEVTIINFPTLEQAVANAAQPGQTRNEGMTGSEETASGVPRKEDVIMMSYETDGPGAEALEGEARPEEEAASEAKGSRAEDSIDQLGDSSMPEEVVEAGRQKEEGHDEIGRASEEINEGRSEKIISEIFTPEGNEKASGAAKNTDPGKMEQRVSDEQPEAKKKDSDLNRKLKRRILELKTLFSISSDFNAIRNKKKLLDIFLLTSIAQGGVESALFLEEKDGVFKPLASKGIKKKLVEGLDFEIRDINISALSNGLSDIDTISGNTEIQPFKDAGFENFSLFSIDNEVAGICLFGKRLSGRNMREEDLEFLNILSSVAQSAYRNTVMLEREHERTLGIVKTLISMIEENTLLKGTSEFVSRYVGIVAKSMNYPEEDFKNLIYGTVLRDMGMIKISDLIIKSPRELSKEEWAVIKKHPDDGAEMLRRMRFSTSVVDIVRSHHERFNGEGYPRGLRGKEIPLGARIISVVESYAAMIHDRPTRAALSEREALETLKENYGLRYDMEVTRCFARVMEREIAKSADPAVTVPEE